MGVGSKAKHIDFAQQVLMYFGLSGAALGGSLTTWSRLVAVLEPLGSML